MEIEVREVVLISKILYNIHSIKDNFEMRKTFLEMIPNLVSCSKASFYLGALEENHFIDRPVGYQMSQELLDSYLAYDKHDYMNKLFSDSVTEVYKETDFFVDDVRKNSIYFQQLLVPNDMYYSVQISLYYSKIFLGVVALFRGKDDTDFSDHDIFLLGLLKDHLALYLYNDFTFKNKHSITQGFQKYVELYNITLRETEVLQLIFEGLSNDEMAERLHISHYTIQKHISNIYKKLHVSNRTQLLKLYSESNT